MTSYAEQIFDGTDYTIQVVRNLHRYDARTVLQDIHVTGPPKHRLWRAAPHEANRRLVFTDAIVSLLGILQQNEHDYGTRSSARVRALRCNRMKHRRSFVIRRVSEVFC